MSKDKAPILSPIPAKQQAVTKMSFLEALAKIVDGKRITRLDKAWITAKSYGELKDGFIKIFVHGETHDWIISEGDIEANDWVVVKTEN